MPQLEKLWRPFAFLLFNVPPIPSLVEAVVSAVIVGCCSIHNKIVRSESLLILSHYQT